MILRTLGSVLALCLAAALLSACPPPVQTDSAAEGDADATTGTRASANDAARDPAGSRREQRRDASALPSGDAQYKYIDERGKLRVASRLEDIPERQRSTASLLEPPASAVRHQELGDDGRALQTADVTIYTTSYCGYCRAAMAHFDQIGIEYVNHDVENDEEARAEYLELTGGRRGVPVIVVGEAWMQGWNKPEFDRLLASSN